MIHAIDFNPAQNYLLELKIACVKVCSREENIRIFNSDYDLFLEKYPQIREEMSPEARIWWDEKHSYLMPNFAASGAIRYVLKPFRFVFWLFGLNRFFAELRAEPGIETQRRLHSKYRARGTLFVYAVAKLAYLIRSFVGVPERQLEMLANANDGEDLGAYFRKVIDHLLHHTDLRKNFFFRGYIYGNSLLFDDTCCPPYLKEENFDAVRQRLHVIKIFTGDIASMAVKHCPTEGYDRINLLDSMDWYPDTWRAIHMYF